MGNVRALLSRPIELYLRLIGVQIRSQLQYPIPFVMDILISTWSTLIFFIALALVLQRFGSLAGWNIGEIAFLWGIAEASFGLNELIFSGFDDTDFSQLIRKGSFDQFLLRPVTITLQVLGSRFYLRRLGRILEGIIIFTYSLSVLHLTWSPGRAGFLLLVVIGQVLFFGGLFITGATITIWTIEPIEVINIFTYGGVEVISYPFSIYPDWLRNFFTYILPAIFLNYYPALYLLNKPDPFHLPGFAVFLAPLAGLFVFLAAYTFWRVGLRHYQSTGS